MLLTFMYAHRVKNSYTGADFAKTSPFKCSTNSKQMLDIPICQPGFLKNASIDVYNQLQWLRLDRNLMQGRYLDDINACTPVLSVNVGHLNGKEPLHTYS